MTTIRSARASRAATMISAMGALLALGTTSGMAANGDAGLSLPPGFKATIFADKLGHARQMAFGPDGTLYLNTWSGRYYKSDDTKLGGFLVALKANKDDGHADTVSRFGETFASGGHGGTGIAVYKDGLYAEIDDKIVRYPIKDGVPAADAKPTVVVSGMPITGDHPMHPIAVDAKGNLFIDLGSATNACQSQNRMTGSKGEEPCVEKETRGGIWRYDANKTDQAFSAAARFATGIRNGEGLSFDAGGNMFSTQHGRDQLYENWSGLYKPVPGHELPAEEMVLVKQGHDYGWPECYFDGGQQKLVLAPEYGGDGGKKVGVCAERDPPVAFFPAHWAPNDLKIYEGKQFPSAYDGGAFIAFHGSWNRAPAPQGGYNVVFQPLKDGKAAGPWTLFADGFAGAVKEPGRAAFRPSGLAIGPRGALFISDDIHGRVWRVTYEGGKDAAVESAPPKKTGMATASDEVLPPEGIHPDAGKMTANLPVPPGATKEQVAQGERIFTGEVNNGTCGGCHGSDAGGGPIGPDLTSGKWLWSDGSLRGITQTISTGVPAPKEHPGAMPAMGGTQMSEPDLKSVAAYVWAVGHQKAP